MKLNELLNSVNYDKINGNTEVEISGLCTDSRLVKRGDLFFAYKGGKHDSHGDISEAINGGAVAVICERPIEGCAAVQIITRDGRGQIAPSARAFTATPIKN